MNAWEPGAERVRGREAPVAGHVLLDAVGGVAGALAEPEANERSAGRQIATVELAHDPDGAAPGDARRRHADQLDLCRDDDVNLARCARFKCRGAAVGGLDQPRGSGGQLRRPAPVGPRRGDGGLREHAFPVVRCCEHRTVCPASAVPFGMPSHPSTVVALPCATCLVLRVTTCGITTTRIVFLCGTLTGLPWRVTVVQIVIFRRAIRGWQRATVTVFVWARLLTRISLW